MLRWLANWIAQLVRSDGVQGSLQVFAFELLSLLLG